MGSTVPTLISIVVFSTFVVGVTCCDLVSLTTSVVDIVCCKLVSFSAPVACTVCKELAPFCSPGLVCCELSLLSASVPLISSI